MRSIPRFLWEPLQTALQPGKVVVLLGARRTGKTHLIQEIMRQQKPGSFLLLNGEDIFVQQQLSQRTVEHYRTLAAGYSLVIIDEAQKVPDIGMALKLMVDELPHLALLVTGSSLFDLKNRLGEPLTGRKKDFFLYPIAQVELSLQMNAFARHALMENHLIYGSYPELFHLSSHQKKSDYLRELVSSYLFKDILSMENLRNADKLTDLLKLLAWQVGQEVSLEALGRNLQMSKNTVERYLDLLSKVFVVFRVPGFSRNLRKEIVKTKRWYFYDNGIRNTLINNLQPVRQRNDVGMLWENYLASERVKLQSYLRLGVSNYFWRTHDRQEIDWVEDRDGKLYAYEFKWQANAKTKAPKAWAETYPGSKFKIISPDTMDAFVLKK